MSFLQISRFRPPPLAFLVLLAAVSTWLWPIGLGGRIPVGGDVTQFSMGLMATLGEALRSGRVPLWNDRWGFGFPGLAESQMGYYYPPHAILYRFLSTEAAYTASLVLHTYFAAIGAYWMALRFGVSQWGSAVAGWAWAASGMFLIHLPHQWGYTAGSWMPWAIGLGWTIATGERGLKSAFLLAALLALQILPGHFQFAFQTQAMLGLMAIGTLAIRPRGIRSALKSSLAIVLAIAAAIPLSAAQLLPTWELAKSAQTQRTFDYLSAFAAPPPHLASYIAPNLFHLSPLWRPLAWDPFHAMPEEHRPYIGLIPLMLALGAIRRNIRSDRGIRILVGLSLAATLLSFGPYIPGFAWWIQLPGFSFFRAPSRWGLAAELMLAVLAGKGFDAWRSWPKIGRSTIRFALIAATIPLMLIGLVELSFASSDRNGIPVVAETFESARRVMPWRNDPTFSQVMAASRRGPRDPLIITGLISEGIAPRTAATMTLSRERRSIYARELFDTAAMILLVGLLAIPLARGWRGSEALILLLAFGDLMLLSRHRAIGTAPIRPLVEQSAVLNMMSKLSPGSRTIDPFRNLPMVAGASPASAYRTLDRPSMTGLLGIASSPLDGSIDRGLIQEAMRAIGATVRVLDPLEPGDGEPLRDPVLASWVYGSWGALAPPFRAWRPGPSLPRAFFLPGPFPKRSDPMAILLALRKAEPLSFDSVGPEEFTVRGAVRVPGVVVVSILGAPGWRVVDELDANAPITRVLRPIFAYDRDAGWMSVGQESPGTIQLRWRYHDSWAAIGRWLSASAWAVWLAGLVTMLALPRSRTRET